MIFLCYHSPMHWFRLAYNSVWFWYMAIIALIITQFFFWPSFGTTDTYSFIDSAATVDEYGLRAGYLNYNLNYPPLSSALLYPLTAFVNYRSLSADMQLWLIKALEAIFYYGFVITVVLWYRKRSGTSVKEVGKKTFFILANIALIESAIMLSYFDIFLALPLFGAYYAIHKQHFFWAGVCLATSFMIKLVPIFLVPAFIIYCTTLQRHRLIVEWKKLFTFIVGLIVIIIPLVWYFSYDAIHTIIQFSADHGQMYLSFTYNLPKIIEIFQYPDNITRKFIYGISQSSFYLVTALLLVQLWVSKKTVMHLLYAGIGIFFSYYILLTGVHENHLFPAVILALLLYLWQSRLQTRLIYYGLTVIFFISLWRPYSFGRDYMSSQFVIQFLFGSVDHDIMSLYLSGIFTMCYLLYLIFYFRLPPPYERLGKLR